MFCEIFTKMRNFHENLTFEGKLHILGEILQKMRDFTKMCCIHNNSQLTTLFLYIKQTLKKIEAQNARSLREAIQLKNVTKSGKSPQFS